MEEYPSNSIKEKTDKPAKKLEKVTTGVVKSQKKTEGQKFKEAFMAEITSNVKHYTSPEVLVPSIKNAIWDLATFVLNMALYGEGRRDRRSNVPGAKVSYTSFYQSNDSKRDYTKPRPTSGFDYDDLVFVSRGDAEAVLSAMEDAIDRYGFVSILDMYDLAEVSTSNYTLGNYGWKNLRNSQTVPVNGGYILKLPKAEPLK